MLQEEYFIIESENNGNYPMFSWDQSSGAFGQGRPVKIKQPVKMRLGEPVPANFEWADYYEVPGPVVSRPIAEVLAAMKIYGVQLVPAKVGNPKEPDSVARDYWFIHVWNRISCLDRSNSELELYGDGTIFSIEELQLDENSLASVEPDKRLFFGLCEKRSVLLLHRSIKDAIESVKPR